MMAVTRTRTVAPPPAGAPSDADIRDRLVQAVLDHRLKPGTRLGEDRLGQIFGVSRTRIRQVLISLAQEQIVTLVPNRGATVAQPTRQEAQEVFEARRLIEPLLVERFVQRARAPQWQALAANIRAEEAARRAGDRPTEIRLSGDFHRLLAEGAQHDTLGRMLSTLISRTSLILMAFGPTSTARVLQPAPPASHEQGSGPGRVRRWHGNCGCDDHRALLAALKLKDAQAARQCMSQHLQSLEDGLQLTAPVSDPTGVPLASWAPADDGLASLWRPSIP